MPLTRPMLLWLVTAVGCRALTPGSKTGNAWSAPMELPGMPSDQLHRSPSITSVGDTLYMAANVYPTSGTTASFRPIYVARIPGGALAAPAGDFQFVFPRIIADSRGAVHLLWTEFSRHEPNLMDWGSSARTALWHAVYRAGSWSSPQRILSGQWLEWPRSGGHISADPAGALHVVLLTMRTGFTGTTHLMWNGDHWQARTLPYQRRKFAVHAGANALYIGIDGPPSSSVTDSSGIAVAVMQKGDSSGGSPVVVHRLAGRVASELQFVGSDDALHLAWAEAPNGGSPDTLRVIRLDGAGRRVATLAVALPPGANTAQLVSGCRGLAFVAETFSRAPQVYVGAIGASGEVAREELLPNHELTAFAGLARLRNRLAVIAVSRRDSLTRPRAVMLSHSCQ